jgi:hypothetical protein
MEAMTENCGSRRGEGKVSGDILGDEGGEEEKTARFKPSRGRDGYGDTHVGGNLLPTLRKHG